MLRYSSNSKTRIDNGKRPPRIWNLLVAVCAVGVLLTLIAPLSAQKHTRTKAAPGSTSTALATASVAGKDPQLSRRILAILQKENARQAHWGIEVAAVKTDDVLFAFDPDKLFTPASSAKVFTLAAALMRLGTKYTYQTTIETSAPVSADGHVAGDLVLVGRGDPNLSGRVLPFDGRTERDESETRIFGELADQVAARGIHAIDGDLIADDRYFVYEPYGQGWQVDDLLWWYGAPVSALAINDNIVSLNVQPADQAGSPPKAWLDPPGAGYNIENEATTVARARKTLPKPRLGLDRQPGSAIIRLWGDVLEGSGTWKESLAVDNPPAFAAEVLRQELKNRGIEVKGANRVLRLQASQVADLVGTPPVPSASDPPHPAIPQSMVLASHRSAPLPDSLKVIAKVSQNLHAEMLLRTLGRERRGVGSYEAGLEEVSQFVKEAGVEPTEVALKDGSGLSRLDLVSPHAALELMRYMYNSAFRAIWYDLLPVGGVDGSLERRFRKPEMVGRVHAKTGTLDGVEALTGYVSNQKGEPVAFAIFVNQHIRSTQEMIALIDQVVEEIAKSG